MLQCGLEIAPASIRWQTRFMRRWLAGGVPALLCVWLNEGLADSLDPTAADTRAPVGRQGANAYQTPVSQVLTPAGIQVDLPRLRPQAIALSPDRRLLVTAGLTPEVVVINPATGKILQRVPLPVGTGRGPVARYRLHAHSGAGQKRPGQLHRPGFFPGRLPPLSLECQREHQSLRRGSGASCRRPGFHPAAVGEGPPQGGRYSGGTGRVS